VANYGADFNAMEQAQAKRDGAKAVSNSGRGTAKGDATRGPFMIDYKFTDGKSFSLNIENFQKFWKQAVREYLEPVIVAVFNQYNGRTVAMIDWDYLKSIQDQNDLMRSLLIAEGIWGEDDR
jgi:hypothetical protein